MPKSLCLLYGVHYHAVGNIRFNNFISIFYFVLLCSYLFVGYHVQCSIHMLSDRHFCDSFKPFIMSVVLMSSWLILVSFLCSSRDT